jgi:hypothetical protein
MKLIVNLSVAQRHKKGKQTIYIYIYIYIYISTDHANANRDVSSLRKSIWKFFQI